MRIYTIVLPILLVILLALPCSAIAEPMRCGKWVVNEESSAAEVLEKCGAPQQKERTESDVLAKNAAGYPVKLGVQVTERWFYKRSPGSLPMLVTIVDGRLKSIERIDSF